MANNKTGSSPNPSVLQDCQFDPDSGFIARYNKIRPDFSTSIRYGNNPRL